MWNVGLFVSLALFGWLRLLGHVTDPLLNDRAIHQIIGEPAGVARVVDEPQGLKVVTWNIQRGAEFDRILTTLQSLSPDIILLQEVDAFCRRSGWRDVAKDLADALEMNWVRAGEFQEIGESRRGVPALTGQAVLSKYSIEDSAVIPFAAQARLRWRLSPLQPRRGGRMALRFRTAGILVYNSHIESGGNDKLRRWQVEEILADQTREAHGEAPVVIAGDFNNSPAIRSSMFGPLTAAAFADALLGNEVRRTSIHHKHPIDWIFVKNLKARSSQVSEVAHASDHYPVLAMLATAP